MIVQTATLFQGYAASALEDVAWLTEAAADAGASTVGGGLLAAGDAGRPTFNVLRIRGACHWRGEERD